MKHYESVIWLSAMPDRPPDPTSSDDSVLFTLEYDPPRPHPRIPEKLRGLLDETALADPRSPAPELNIRALNRPGDLHHHGPATDPIPQPEASDDIVGTFREWLSSYQNWCHSELAAEPQRKMYGTLHEIARRSAQIDDKYEVVLGVGLLGRNESKFPPLSRHVITRRISISLQQGGTRLTVSLDSESTTRMEDREFLGEQDGYSSDRSARLREQLDNQDLDPLDEDCWSSIRTWAELAFDHAVHCNGGWGERADLGAETTLARAPAIILRERSANALALFYDQIAEALAAPRAMAPLGLAQLLVPLERAERISWPDGNRDNIADPGQKLLLPLVTNAAQRNVLERMNSDTAVVVQGPPGTGKTHTIANLTCALLAQGQRVLVTSQREQALRELRDKLPPSIRDLCVAFTGTRRDGTDDFSRSVAAISDHLGSVSPTEVEAEIREVSERRDALSRQAEWLRDKLLRSREAEWAEHPEIAPGYQGTLAQIAARVVSLASQMEWLSQLNPDSSSPLAEPPLSGEEALELQSLLAQETDTRRARRVQQFPNLESVPAPETFERSLSAARDADGLISHATVSARAIAALSDEVLTAIRHQAETATAAHRRARIPAQDPGQWKRCVLADMLAGHAPDAWRDIGGLLQEIQACQRAIDNAGPQEVTVPALPYSELTAMLRAAVSLSHYLASGGRFGARLFASREQRAAQRLLASCLVDGRAPSNAGDVNAAHAYLEAAVTTRRHMSTWAIYGVKPTDKASVRELLRSLTLLYSRLQDIRTVADASCAIAAVLAKSGIRTSHAITLAEWESLCRDIEAAQALAKAQHDCPTLADLVSLLPQPRACDPPELDDLRHAARAEDASLYRQAHMALGNAVAEWHDRQRCDVLHDRLRQWHPRLASELARTASDSGWEEKLRFLSEAAAWQVAKAFCENAHETGDDQDPQRTLDDVEVHRSHETERLAAAQAWISLLRRITQEDRQSLEAYRVAIGRLGRGTGRYAGHKRQAVRSAMRNAQGAVPAWIMPVGKVAETVPPVQDSFDVVIIDEASQCGLEALFLLWLAPRVIVVGDDKQCAPGWSDQEHQKYLDRLDLELPDLTPHERLAFMPGSSLYELLLMRFPEPVRLNEHFRSMPEIIGWSSRRFYDDNLIPFRQFGPDRLPPLQVVHVEDGQVEGRDRNIHNDNEAKHLVEKLRELLERPEYASPPRTFGIISLQGTAQARRIRQMINASIEPVLIERHDIRVGDPPDFQGAEFDVIMLSMVASSGFTAKTGLQDQRRFNVAATRAKDQLWLFTSVPRDSLKPDDLRFSLLAHMENSPSQLGDLLPADEVPADRMRPPFESLFQQRVFCEIRQRGYHVVPQFPIGKHRIDLVVSGSTSRLAIECDERILYADPSRIGRDFAWEQDLRRTGWQFWRIRESEFLLAPEQTLNPLWTELGNRGIFPQPDVTTAMTEDPETRE